MNDIERRKDLADFLRTRRARISPQQAGLPSGVRRKTAGLRREELAQLASVSVIWYTWLEQRRDINVSPQIKAHLFRGKLDEKSRAALSTFAGKREKSDEKSRAASRAALDFSS